MRARMPAVATLVGRRDQTALGGDALGHAPERRDLYAVNALAPRVPLRQTRLVQAVFQLHAVKLAARHLAQLRERRLYVAQDFGREPSFQVRAQRAVVLVLVAESRRLLSEGHHTLLRALTCERDLAILTRAIITSAR